MLLPPPFVSPSDVWNKLVITGSVAAITWLIMWPFRALRKKWNDASTRLEIIERELVQQRTNHLTHIETNTKNTVDVLNKLHDTQTEMNGYLKGISK
jgi:hypothetical protein